MGQKLTWIFPRAAIIVHVCCMREQVVSKGATSKSHGFTT